MGKFKKVGQDLWEHPDYTVPRTTSEVFEDLFERIERLESMWVTVTADVRFDYDR